jgi:RNA polymerase sigma factor (sigma-70 family)
VFHYHCNLAEKNLSEATIYAWIEGCRKNDRQSQEAMYRHFYNDMYVTCKRYADDPHDALTILNDGYLKAFSNISKYRPELGNFKPWLKTIIIHTAIDFTRKQKQSTQIIHIDNIREQGQEDFILNYNWKQEEILQHFKTLPSVTRLVINLFAFDGYSHKDIAEELDISETTSRWHVSEARKRLKVSMQLVQHKKDNQI